MSIQEIQELTKNIPTSIKELAVFKPATVQELKTETGKLLMFGLYKSKKIAISRIFATAGTRMAVHSHNSIEYALVWEGELIFDIGGKKLTLKEKEHCKIESNTPHSVYWPVDTSLLAVVIPAEEGWPNGN